MVLCLGLTVVGEWLVFEALNLDETNGHTRVARSRYVPSSFSNSFAWLAFRLGYHTAHLRVTRLEDGFSTLLSLWHQSYSPASSKTRKNLYIVHHLQSSATRITFLASLTSLHMRTRPIMM